MINILCKFPPDWLQEVRGAVLQGSGGVMVEDESNTGYFHLREIVAEGSRSDTKAREDAILRDPNLNTLYHSIGQEALPSLGVENLRPRGIWFPLSCNKVPDDKPRASKQWKRRGGTSCACSVQHLDTARHGVRPTTEGLSPNQLWWCNWLIPFQP